MLKRASFACALAAVAASCAPMTGPEPVAGDSGPQACPIAKYTPYIGRNRSELPAAASNESRRVVCTTCPVTMDYHADRTTIAYDEQSGIVRDVKCG